MRGALISRTMPLIGKFGEALASIMKTRVRVKVRGGEQWYEGLLEIVDVDERFGYLLIPGKDGFWDLKLVELMSPSWGDLIIEEE